MVECQLDKPKGVDVGDVKDKSSQVENTKHQDMCVQFNENHVLKKLGLTHLEDHEELRKMIKPTHRQFLYKLLDIKDKKTNTDDSHSGDEISQAGNERTYEVPIWAYNNLLGENKLKIEHWSDK